MVKNAPATQFNNLINENSAVFSVVAFVYSGLIITASIFFGLSPWLYVLFIILGAVLIIPSYSIGFKLIIVLTMVFERFFTLQSLVVDRQIYKIYPIDIIIGLTMIGWLISYLRPKIKESKPIILWQAPEKILFVFLIISLLYYLRAIFDFGAKPEVAFSTLKNYAFYPLLYFLTIYSVQTAKKLKNTIHLILLGGVLIIGFIVAGFSLGQGLWTEFTPLSTSGVRFLAGTHAFYLTLTTIIALSLLSFKRFWNNSYATAIVWVWLIGIAGSLMRHLWLALIFGAVILLIFMPKKNKNDLIQFFVKNGLIALSLVAIVFLAVNLYATQNFGQGYYDLAKNLEQRVISITNTDSDTSASWRIGLWRSAQKAWQTNPIIGIGFGQTIKMQSGDFETIEEIRNIHNSPLALLVQMGVVGFLALAAFILSVIIKGLQYLYNDRELMPYYLGILGGIAIFLFASLFQPYLETNLMAIFLWILLGLLRTSEIINNDKRLDKVTG